MTEKPIPSHDQLLKMIHDKLVWINILLVLIMLNTCSLGDDLSDAARDLRKASRPAAVQPQG